ncbi:MAG: hypothetical protein BWY56_02497 [Acidobacteria bacterium ADurb.Bin340]|nr:MAG: hypothetical protein BWY56_02497 [Acidobacteria bacterium ADurb.Bin340]
MLMRLRRALARDSELVAKVVRLALNTVAMPAMRTPVNSTATSSSTREKPRLRA